MTAAASPTALALLSLMKLKSIGRQKALKIVENPIGETDPSNYREALLLRMSQVHKTYVSPSDLSNVWMQISVLLHQSQDAGIQVLSFYDEGYPKRLQKIPNPPAVLFVKGKKNGLHADKSLAVVGTREPTIYGKKIAQGLAYTATQNGFVIVSGLAHGCDTYAHKGCLEAQGVGVAVLAHGLDKVYPAANRNLAECLLEHGGCLVSEYPIGKKPFRSAFAERDRIQSGLSDAVLVVETDVEGGTMHTVRFARTQERLLLCVAHPKQYLPESKTKGNQKLIKDNWATPIRSKETFKQSLNDIVSVVSRTTQKTSTGGTDDRRMSWAF